MWITLNLQPILLGQLKIYQYPSNFCHFSSLFSTISSRDKPKKMFFYRGQSKRLISWLIHQNKLQYCVDLHWDSCKAGEQTILHNTHFSLTIPLSIKHLLISIVKCHTCTPFPSLSLFSNLVTSLSCVFPSWSVLFFFFFLKKSVSLLLSHFLHYSFMPVNFQWNFQLTLLA